jgi:2-polyprenyl-3-methyl-5-hydroxy-6-metoxy-1,4-benzoquinol methylase
LNKTAAAKARAIGFKVSTKPLEYYQPKKSYDVVVLSNVLEHSLNPKKMLTHVSMILKKGGKVWISCPNIDSWQRNIFKKYWINWHVPFHIFHFSKKTLSTLLKETGFEIVEEKQKSPSLWLAQTFIARLFAKPGRTTIQMRNPFLVASLMLIIRFFLFPLLWVGNLSERGDCLLVLAKKV